MKRFILLILMSLMLIPVYGCGGGGKPQGEGELLTENPRARHYDQDATDVGDDSDAAEQQEQ